MNVKPPTKTPGGAQASPGSRCGSSRRHKATSPLSIYLEADDLGAAFKLIGTSDEPFDRWFRDHVRDVHGLSLEQGFPPPEQILDLDTDGI